VAVDNREETIPDRSRLPQIAGLARCRSHYTDSVRVQARHCTGQCQSESALRAKQRRTRNRLRQSTYHRRASRPPSMTLPRSKTAQSHAYTYQHTSRTANRTTIQETTSTRAVSQQRKGMPRYYNINSTGSCIPNMLKQLHPRAGGLRWLGVPYVSSTRHERPVDLAYRSQRFTNSGVKRLTQRMIVVCESERPRSAIISTRSRRLSL
jgi:hypothetical protein